MAVIWNPTNSSTRLAWHETQDAALPLGLRPISIKSYARKLVTRIARVFESLHFSTEGIGRTYIAGISRASCPSICSLRLRCAPDEASTRLDTAAGWRAVFPPARVTRSLSA